MAIIKVVKKSGKTHTSLKKALKYVGEKAYETYGINCSDNYNKVAYEFFETKKYFDNTEGRQYRHYIQSFSPNEVSKEKVLEIAIKWAEKSFPNHEVFISVHDDKEHLHSHFIVNTVNFETGKKLHETVCNLALKKEFNDEVCLNYGVKNKEMTKEIGDITTYDKNKYQIIKKGADITRLAETILKNMEISISKEQFIDFMKKDGYITEWKEDKKHITFTIDAIILQGKKDKFRLSNLEKTFNIPEFNKEKLLEIFDLNKDKNKVRDLETIIKEMKPEYKTNENITKFEISKSDELKIDF